MPPYMEKVKKLAPMVGLTLAVNVFPTCCRTREVFPTPACGMNVHIAHVKDY